MRKAEQNSALFDLIRKLMKIVYGKNLTEQENLAVKNISYNCDILFDTARLLYYRNIDTPDKAKRFLNPGKTYFHDPFLLSGMSEAVKKISFAKAHGQKVLIFGDYDADGVCATSVLYYCLRDYGIDPMITVPEREEGYGLNFEKITSIRDSFGVDLVISVDCGISDIDTVEKLKQNGIDVIVTDHHEPPSVLPDCIKINPKLKGQSYPFDGLCGAGVAYKLGCALIGARADEYLDLVSLATVADSMDLVDENRDIVFEGLKLFNGKKIRTAFKYMINDTQKAVTSQTLAYQIAPRINAGGRMGDADCALKLFTSQDEKLIFNYAVKLNEYNIARQTECDNIYRQAKAKIISGELYKDEIILVSDEKWKTGFVGIVAARLVEEYNRPIIVFAGADGHLKGSARSVTGVNIYEVINSASDVLIGFGGHSQAAGLSVEKENFENLRVKLCNFIKTNNCRIETQKTLYVDMYLTSPVSKRFAKEINMLEPFGVGNRKPLFSVSGNAINSVPMKQSSPHYSFTSDVVDMLDFNGEKNSYVLSLPVKKNIVFEFNYSVFKGRESLKGIVKNVLPEYGNFSALDLYVAENQICNLKNDTEYKVLEGKKEIKDGYGTLYAVSNVKTLKNYSGNLRCSMYTPEEKNNENCIVVCPKEIPEGYNEIVYLDRPLESITSTVPVYIDILNLGCEYVDTLSVERNDFTEIYNYLLTCCGKKFSCASEFYLNNAVNFEPYNFLFATSVFLELEFFYVKDGVLKRNAFEKKALINSKIYSKILALKG